MHILAIKFSAGDLEATQVFLVKLDSAGVLQYSVLYGDEAEVPIAMAFAPSGNLALVMETEEGSFWGGNIQQLNYETMILETDPSDGSEITYLRYNQERGYSASQPLRCPLKVNDLYFPMQPVPFFFPIRNSKVITLTHRILRG